LSKSTFQVQISSSYQEVMFGQAVTKTAVSVSSLLWEDKVLKLSAVR
jgi:hypothetical protein